MIEVTTYELTTPSGREVTISMCRACQLEWGIDWMKSYKQTGQVVYTGKGQCEWHGHRTVALSDFLELDNQTQV